MFSCLGSVSNKVQALFPLGYAYTSRYREDWSFYVLVEYVPALFLAVLFGKYTVLENLGQSVLSYFAFISLYEIGYIVNDHVSVRWEASPRHRWPSTVGNVALVTWVLSRLIWFVILSEHVIAESNLAYWAFFGFLLVVFSIHNLTARLEVKACTFYWLSFCRYVASTVWVIQAEYLSSLFLSASLLYSGFRLLGYLESKELLSLPNRKQGHFRLTYYLLPLPCAVAMSFALGLQPFGVLAVYYFLGSVLKVVGKKPG